MKILYVIDSLANGGAERSLAAMVPLYGRHGLDLEVVTLVERSGVHAEVAAAVPVSVLSSATRRGRALELRSLVARRRPDVVHSTLFEADVVSRLAVGGKGPVLVSSLVNDSYGPAHLASAGVPGWKIRAVQAVDAVTARRVRRFHAISEHVATAMQKRLRIPAARIEVVPRGRDPEVLGRRTPQRRAATRAALGVEPGVPLVVAAARQERQKGLDVLLDAWPAVKRGVPAARLVMAGRDGAASAALRRRAVEVGAHLLGDRADVPDLLVAADAFAFPSRWEGAGGTLLEAMALEAPVVTSDLPPARELLDGAASFVSPDDPAGLADALVAVLGERPDAAVAEARQRFVDRYTVDAVVARMARLLPAGPRVTVRRVVHVVATEQRRGAEVFAADLVRALAAGGTDQHVVVLRPGAATAVDFGAPTTRLPSAPAGPLAAVAAVRGLRGALRPHPGAVVCAHGGEALRAAALGGARPLVYRRIGSAPPSITTGPRRRWHRYLMGRATLVVCVAEAVREETLRVFALDASRVRTVPNGVDPDRLAAPDRAGCLATLGLAPDARVVLSLGSLSWEKDPLRALRITGPARASDERAVHLFVGDGPLAADVRAAAGPAGRVTVLPARPDVGTVLGAADLLLLSSRTEGMPAVVIEAGLRGLPVVADRVAGVAEVVVDGGTGVLVAPGDDRAAAEAVSALLNDDGWRNALGAAAALRCAERFAIGPVADAYLAAFDEAALCL